MRNHFRTRPDIEIKMTTEGLKSSYENLRFSLDLISQKKKKKKKKEVPLQVFQNVQV